VRRPHFVRIATGLLAGLLSVSTAHAELKIHGYADLVGSTTGSLLTIPGIGNRGRALNLDGASDVGLNLSADLGDHWDFAGQVVARGNASFVGQPGYIASADWLFLSYRPTDEWLVRAGRQIYPLFLYSEQIDVGFIYPWVRLPQTVYSIIPLKSFNGLLGSYTYTYGQLRMSAATYGGSGTLEQVSAQGIGGLSVFDEHVRAMYVAMESDVFKVMFSYKISHPLAEYYIPSPTGNGTQTKVSLDLGNVNNWGAGARFDDGHLMILTEGTGFNSNISDRKVTGAYGTLGYHFFSGRLTPHFTYGKLWSSASYLNYPDQAIAIAAGAGGFQKVQMENTLGLNFRATNSLVLKADYQNDRFQYRDSKLDFDAETYSLGLSAVF
jgi:hypothetical protein